MDLVDEKKTEEPNIGAEKHLYNILKRLTKNSDPKEGKYI
jgi:hypothetical protein